MEHLLRAQQELAEARKGMDEHSDEFAEVSHAMNTITRAVRIVEQRGTPVSATGSGRA